ncbi:MAG: DUF262 domain-containing protein [Thermoanaerobaculia bacterium]|nr:MAG: DUF262 domain-containing protein [Thermoanaerobaculia bacterium]MBZ0100582.1 DUF262 domain-containing protein [Thermoanaerobaculia bacterium]
MSLFEDTNPHALKNLLAEIHNRTTALPNFQRDFVWDPGATQELIVSIANNYPAGSILRVRDTKRVFVPREFEGAPVLDGARHTFLVLDGQQRLTSLYQAFFGVGEHRYFLKLRRLMDGADIDEAIMHVRASTKWAQRRASFELQAQELLLPLSELQGGAGRFGQWSRRVARTLKGSERIALEDALDEIEERWIKTIDDYHFPVVTLSDKTEPAALCTIFETLNRTGVKLSVFELLTARFWPADLNLRSLWEQAVNEHRPLDLFEVDPYYVLQGIALASRRAPSCKRSDVLGLQVDDVRAWWGPVAKGLARGLEILRDDCKVMLPKWLPYSTMLPPLAAVLARAGAVKGPEEGVRRERLKQWFWCAVFGQAYETSPNSEAARDVSELLDWLKGGPAPQTVTGFRFDPRALRDVTPRQRSVYRGTICLILSGGARDFHTLAPITGKLMAEQGIDDHHVFPAAWLDRQGQTTTRQRDCVLNRTLIDRTTNQLISDRSPSDYLMEIESTAGFPSAQVLGSHALPTGPDSPLRRDDFDSFIRWRQEQIWHEIQRVTGAAQPADLEVNGEQEFPT